MMPTLLVKELNARGATDYVFEVLLCHFYETSSFFDVAIFHSVLNAEAAILWLSC